MAFILECKSLRSLEQNGLKKSLMFVGRKIRDIAALLKTHLLKMLIQH